jgi:hypothetical protein
MKAFPLSNMTGLNQQGMDLRDYFAAKAMQTILSDGLDPKDTAAFAYEYADAMMKAREK